MKGFMTDLRNRSTLGQYPNGRPLAESSYGRKAAYYLDLRGSDDIVTE